MWQHLRCKTDLMAFLKQGKCHFLQVLSNGIPFDTSGYIINSKKEEI
jgi:hypothetical protein